jgi:hypothetical protein
VRQLNGQVRKFRSVATDTRSGNRFDPGKLCDQAFRARPKMHIRGQDWAGPQITRLKYYGLKLFKSYLDQILPTTKEMSLNELCRFGEKFNHFFDRPQKLICRTLSQSYREILKREVGTAFSLPRDAQVWDLVKTKFEDNLALIRDLEK